MKHKSVIRCIKGKHNENVDSSGNVDHDSGQANVHGM